MQNIDRGRLRPVVLTVALLNFAYFLVEFTVALAAGSVSLLADSVDFLEDTSINLLIFIALNNDRVQVDFLLFDVNMRIWVTLLGTTLVGVVIGYLLANLRRRR